MPLGFTCIIRPQVAERLCLELMASGMVEDLIATECQGSGTRVESALPVTGLGLLPKVMVSGTCAEEDRDAVIEAILTQARSGRGGDGKLFIGQMQLSD
jgi:nitrogen regulatory protein PII